MEANPSESMVNPTDDLGNSSFWYRGVSTSNLSSLEYSTRCFCGGVDGSDDGCVICAYHSPEEFTGDLDGNQT